METRANYVLIGAFTLAVLTAAIGFVLWFQNVSGKQQRVSVRIVFEGSASGLRNGGSVNFNGVRVGEVTSVKLDNPRRVVALAMVDNAAPIRRDTFVGLEFQGLTGVAAIALRGGEADAPPPERDGDGTVLLTADPSALQDISESIRATLARVNKIVADNQDSLKNSLENVEAFTATLARNGERFDGLVSQLGGIMTKTDGVMSKTDRLVMGLDKIAGGKDGGELMEMVKSFREFADNLDKRSGALMMDGRRTLTDLSRAINNFDRNPTRILFGASTSSQPAPAPAAAAPPAAAPGTTSSVRR